MNFLANNEKAKDCCKQDDSLTKSEEQSTKDLTVLLCNVCGVRHFVFKASDKNFIPAKEVIDPTYTAIVSQ